MNNSATDWRTVKLTEVTEYVSRGIPPAYTESISGTAVINQKCIRGGLVSFEICRLTDESVKAVPLDKVIQPYDILINSTGTGTVGRVGQVVNLTKKATADTHVTIVRPSKTGIDPLYLGHWLITKQTELENLAGGSTNQVELARSKIESLEVLLPPLHVQKRIAGFFDLLDSAVHQTGKVLHKTKVLKQGLMQDIFENKNISRWETVLFPQISKNLDNKRIPITRTSRDSGKYPYYGATGIVDYVSDYLFDGNYLLISEDGANLKDRNYPIAFSITGKNWVNNHAHVLEFTNLVFQEFVKQYINYVNIEKYLTGMAQPKLNQEKLNQISIPKPSDSETKKYVSLLRGLDERIAFEEKKIEILKTIKSGLVYDIFSRKIEVN